ncbi:adenine methyltransferase, partial [Acinetobacter baumannii]
MNTTAKLGLFGNAEGRTDVWATPQKLFDALDQVFN